MSLSVSSLEARRVLTCFILNCFVVELKIYYIHKFTHTLRKCSHHCSVVMSLYITAFLFTDLIVCQNNLGSLIHCLILQFSVGQSQFSYSSTVVCILFFPLYIFSYIQYFLSLIFEIFLKVWIVLFLWVHSSSNQSFANFLFFPYCSNYTCSSPTQGVQISIHGGINIMSKF